MGAPLSELDNFHHNNGPISDGGSSILWSSKSEFRRMYGFKLFLLTIGTFSIRFFMGNGKPQTAKYHVTTVLPSRLGFAVRVLSAEEASSGK